MSFSNDSQESAQVLGKSQRKALRPWYRKKRFIIPAVLVLLVAVNAANNGANVSNTEPQKIATDSSNSSSTQTQATVDPTLSSSERNAVAKAADYLSFMAFSRSGLIDQLEFEGFSTADATYGVDAQNANWNQQAAEKAAEYLAVSSFSESGLIEQLIFEGFSASEAAYGVKQVGLGSPVSESTGGETASERNAVAKAAEYLSFMAFSRSGLIDQLEFEGFSTADATYGVDAQNANWNQQAAEKAAEYLAVSSFSRSGLIDQLIFEGFSSSEALYGVTQNGF